MNQEKLKELSIEDLEKKVDQGKLVNGFFAGIVLMLYIVTIYSTIENSEFDYMMIVAIASTFSVVSGFRGIKKLEEELKIRKSV